MEKVKDVIDQIWSIPLVKTIIYLLIAFLAAWLAKVLVTKLIKLLKLDAKLDKWGVNSGEVGTSVAFVGKLVYLIVFLLFLPAAINALGLEGVSAPITQFASTFINYIPNIIATAIILFVGIFLGKILSQVLAVLLAKTKIDNLVTKIGKGESTVKISDIIGKIVYALVVLIAVVQGLTILGIEAISAPALSIINSVFGAIPKILLATVIIACGLLIANIVCTLIGNLLRGVGFDTMVQKLIPQMTDSKVSATNVVVNIVKAVIILFIVAQGVDVLGLAVLTNITTAVIGYLPLLIKALVIALIAFFGAGMLESFIVKNMPKAKGVAKLAKAAVFVLAGFMILSQLDFATTIVNSAFIIVMCAFAAAFAIAFGVGGKDFAKKTLNKVEEKKEAAVAEEKSEVVEEQKEENK